MRRLEIAPRPNWRRSIEDAPYGQEALSATAGWSEKAYYKFSSEEIDRIEEAADLVHGLIRDAVSHVISHRLHPLLGYSTTTARLIDESWEASLLGGKIDDRENGLFGRLDFAYDGKDSLKLFAIHYDGPCGLFMASIPQWRWLEERFPDADQFNGLHEALIERWQKLAVGLRGRNRVHLTCATPDAVREGELAYLAATAEEAGLHAATLPIQEIAWDGRGFLDLEELPISWLCKLYPWEAMLEEEFAPNLKKARLSVMDPLWRLPASNHGLLAILWELFPEHPNLCPAGFSERDLPRAAPIVRRSFFGLERAANALMAGKTTLAETERTVNPGGSVWLSRPPFFCDGQREALAQCWMIGDKCLGMSMRESEDGLFGPESPTLPHFFTPKP